MERSKAHHVIKARCLGLSAGMSAAAARTQAVMLRLQDEAYAAAAAARRKAAASLKAARDRARRRGFSQGQRQAAETLTAELLRQRQALHDWLAEMQHECALLAFEAAEAVVQEHLGGSASSLAARISSAVSALQDRTRLRIEVHPADAEPLSALLPDLQGAVCPSAQICRGEALLTTPIGAISLCWREHLQLLRDFSLSGRGGRPDADS